MKLKSTKAHILKVEVLFCCGTSPLNSIFILGFSKENYSNGSSPTQTTPTDLPPPGVSRLSSSGGRGGAGTNMSLDKLTGDSLLFFSYSATAGGSGMTPDPQLGKVWRVGEYTTHMHLAKFPVDRPSQSPEKTWPKLLTFRRSSFEL